MVICTRSMVNCVLCLRYQNILVFSLPWLCVRTKKMCVCVCATCICWLHLCVTDDEQDYSFFFSFSKNRKPVKRIVALFTVVFLLQSFRTLKCFLQSKHKQNIASNKETVDLFGALLYGIDCFEIRFFVFSLRVLCGRIATHQVNMQISFHLWNVHHNEYMLWI